MHGSLEKFSEGPLCCCEYIDLHGERNHILAFCCNCYEFDNCFDRCISGQKIGKNDLKRVMGDCLDRLRCPGRGGAVSFLPIPFSILTLFIALPMIAVAIVSYFQRIALLMTLLVAFQAIMAAYMSRRSARSRILHFWTVAAIAYTLIMFESSVTPLLEIRWDENLVIVLLTALALWNLHLTRLYSNHGGLIENTNGCLIGNGASLENICTVCRTKVHPRTQHCTVCQICVPRYDQHCYWLDCCIGENNQAFFLLGLTFGIPALVYGAMLILTTVCRPVFRYGVLVPSDCSDVSDQLEIGLCYCCAVYCLGLAVLSLGQLLWHIWLVSRGVSGGEWQRQGCGSAPYSRGCCRNWLHLIRSVTSLRQ